MNTPSLPQDMRLLGKLTESELGELQVTLESFGFGIIKHLYGRKFEQMKEEAFMRDRMYGDHRDDILYGNRLGQKDCMDFTTGLLDEIKTEIIARKSEKSIDK